MNIHEYQAKEILKKYGVAVPDGIAAMSVDEAVKAAESMTTDLYVVKAQIHAGGRGAGHFTDNPTGKGGVRLCKTVADVKAAAEAMARAESFAFAAADKVEICPLAFMLIDCKLIAN